MGNIFLVTVTALISGLLATVLTIFWQKKEAVYNRKMKIFETLMSYRYMITSEESVHALNSIDVIFYKNSNVRKAYSEFLNETEKKPEMNPNIADKHLRLLEEIAKILKLKDIRWEDIKHSYYPLGLSEKIQEENMLRKAQLQNAVNLIEKNNTVQNTSSQEQISMQLAVQLLPELIKNPEGLKSLLELGERYGNAK
ncbi:hypothetical protein H5999_06035 [[Clostridium] spiroforme]|nr:hypothetical protein [Thomasclavelia spiroformis]